MTKDIAIWSCDLCLHLILLPSPNFALIGQCGAKIQSKAIFNIAAARQLVFRLGTAVYVLDDWFRILDTSPTVHTDHETCRKRRSHQTSDVISLGETPVVSIVLRNV